VANNNDEQNTRTLRAIILCIVVAMVYTQVFLAPKNKPKAAPQGAITAAPANTAGVSAVRVERSTAPEIAGARPQPVSHPTKAEFEAEPTSFVESNVSRVAISHLGARVVSYKLKDYKVSLQEPVPLDMVDSPDGAVMPLGVYVGNESDEGVRYSLVAVNGAAPSEKAANIKIADNSEVVLDFKGTLPGGRGITKRVKLGADSYLFTVEVVLDQAATGDYPVWLEWAHFYPQAQENARMKISHLTYLDGFDKIRHVQLKDVGEGLRDFGTSRWASVGDIYFMATLIPTVSGRNTMLGKDGEVYLSRVAATANGGKFDLYVGPKDYRTLKFVGNYSLERSIDLGWFSFLALPLLWFLHYLYVFLQNWGLAIIALTLIVKAALLPLSKASFQSMKKMQELQPEIKALRERIKDPTQLNQETLALYSRKGVNPMGGCLPMVIQIPVFLGLYQALLNSIELRHSPFALWITDLSSPEKLSLFGIGVPVMVLLMAATMIIQQWTTPNPSADPAQQKMMMIMPFIFAGMFIIFPMPAGLVLYWLVSNLISIIQQMYMRNAEKGSVYSATLVASLGIFGIGYLLTLI
jgi:YidC/Oxa1 family membrane protein insertase